LRLEESSHQVPKSGEGSATEEDKQELPQKIRKGRKAIGSSEQDKNGKFPCKGCLRPFNYKHYARLHELSHKTWEELEGETVYHERCGQCHKIFFNKRRFKEHSDMHKGTRRHKCSTCNKAFTQQVNLISHSYVHLGAEEKSKVKAGWKNVCYFCSKRFITPSFLNIHMVTHTRERPFKCLTCRKTFTQNGDLTRHKRCHNEETRSPFKCQTCEKSFTENGSLSTHHKTVHLAQKDFKCSQCDKCFGTKSSMKTHERSAHS
jgi:KRAB domain-containing zinc finger protein